MTSHSFATPPETLNYEGKPRHVGVEIEFGSVSTQVQPKSFMRCSTVNSSRRISTAFHLRDTWPWRLPDRA
jgi:hypothetical protein